MRKIIKHLWGFMVSVYILLMLTPAVFAQSDALQSALQNLPRSEHDIENFYKNNGYDFIFTGRGNLERRRAVIAALKDADVHGLPVEEYQVAALEKMMRNTRKDANRAKAEVAMARIFMRYAHDLNSGILTPQEVDEEIAYRPRLLQASTLLQGLVINDPRMFLTALAPSHPDYKRLLVQKDRIENIIKRQLPMLDLQTLREGDRARQVSLLRKHLQLNGFGRLGNSSKFDASLTDAVMRFQSSFGLDVDGIAGPEMLDTLNNAPARQLSAILVNLERQRWLNFARGVPHLFVNIPDYTVKMIENDAITFESRVVVGKVDDDFRTTEFVDEMNHMVINPTWHVPASIAGSEYLPILKEDINFLNTQNMKMFDDEGNLIEPTSVDLDSIDPENFPYFIKQLPDPGNALGKVKFMFPNQFNIYMHDTPQKDLFDLDTRAFSHGCVRVHKPFEFAYTLLGRQHDDAQELFHEILETEKEVFINLVEPIPVIIAYQTVLFDEDRVIYLNDIYGRDEKIFNALTSVGISI